MEQALTNALRFTEFCKQLNRLANKSCTSTFEGFMSQNDPEFLLVHGFVSKLKESIFSVKGTTKLQEHLRLKIPQLYNEAFANFNPKYDEEGIKVHPDPYLDWPSKLGINLQTRDPGVFGKDGAREYERRMLVSQLIYLPYKIDLQRLRGDRRDEIGQRRQIKRVIDHFFEYKAHYNTSLDFPSLPQSDNYQVIQENLRRLLHAA